MSFRQGARQFFEKRGAPTPPLPYDYAVQYIETDGVASYIDTGISSSYTFSWYLDFKLESIAESARGVNGGICGARTDGPLLSGRRFQLMQLTTNNLFVFGSPSTSTLSGPQLDTNRHSAESSLNGIYFDGVQLDISSVPQTLPSEHFCVGKDGAKDPTANVQRTYANVRIYSCVLRDNGAVVFNGIPVVANGVAGLYDSISGTVKTNAVASGTITAGPRV